MASENSLQQRVYDWAIDQLNYEAYGFPTPRLDHLKELCRGDLGDVFGYIIEHVKSEKVAWKINGNLRYHSQHVQAPSTVHPPSCASDMQLNIQEIQKKIECVVEQTKAERVDVEKNELIVLKKEAERDELATAIQNVARQRCMLDAYARKEHEEAGILERHEAVLRHVVQQFEGAREVKMTSYIRRNVDGGMPVLETACMKNVREICEMIVKQKFPADGVAHSDVNSKVVDREIHSNIKKALRQHAASDIVDCLVELSKQDSDSLKTDVRGIAEDVRNGFGAEIEVQHGALLKKFTEIVRLENGILELRSNVASIGSRTDDKVKEMYADDDEALQLVRHLMKMCIEEERLKGEMEHLQKVRRLSTAESTDLSKKEGVVHILYNRIVSEEKHMEALKLILDSRLCMWKQRTIELRNLQHEVCRITGAIFDALSVDQFSSKLLLRQRTLQAETATLIAGSAEVAAVANSNSRISFHPHRSIRGDGIQSSTIPAFQTLLYDIVSLRDGIHRKEWLVELLDALAAEIAREDQYDCDRLMAAEKSVLSVWKQKLEKLLPEVLELEKQTSHNSDSVNGVETAVCNWWEQPAGAIDVGVRIEGKSIKDLLDWANGCLRPS